MMYSLWEILLLEVYNDSLTFLSILSSTKNSFPPIDKFNRVFAKSENTSIHKWLQNPDRCILAMAHTLINPIAIQELL